MTPVILAALDASDHALVTLPVAKELAHVMSGKLHLVHVAHETASPEKILEQVGLEGAELRGLVLHARSGDPSAEILGLAGELGSTIIVMCTHTAAPGSSETIGRTALGVLARARCPVLLVRPERGVVPWQLRRILLPHDGTPTTSAAIPRAAELARVAGAELFVLHVADPNARVPVERGSLTAPRYTDQPQHEWPAWAAEFLERLGCVCPLENVKVRMALTHGDPGKEVLRYASEHASDLVVLAWRGDWKRKHAITTKRIVRHAPCPVLVIRAD